MRVQPVVEAEGVGKVYGEGDTAVPALRGVDLAVAEGEMVAVMGPSGCGKSTLLHALGTVETPTRGDVRFRGRSLAGMDDRERTAIRRDHIGFVFQAFNLVPVLTAEENIALPLVVAGERPKRHRDRIDALIEEVGLDDRRDRLPSQLSGGEQQRVAIARALLREPDLLLADEPTGSLDQAAGMAVLGLLRGIHDQGQTIVIVTHDAKVASHAQRIVLMRDGEIVDEVRPRPPTVDPGGLGRTVTGLFGG
jgi:putative ABC transport system ATP-binding protein